MHNDLHSSKCEGWDFVLHSGYFYFLDGEEIKNGLFIRESFGNWFIREIKVRELPIEIKLEGDVLWERYEKFEIKYDKDGKIIWRKTISD